MAPGSGVGFERDASSTFTDDGDAPGPLRDPGSARYTLGEALGRGASGEVLLARDGALGRDVAVKVLLREDPASRERFLREARVTAGLEHPNVLPVHDVGTDADGRTFLVLKRVEGSPLDAWARGRPLPRRLGVFRQLCDAVRFAHDRGVIHRDLKAANVLVGDHGEVLLADWGVAGPPGPLGGTVVGTPATMAPEVARGERADARSDVFSLGVVLAELAAGEPLRAGTAEAVLGEARHGRLRIPPLPSDLARVVARATAREAADRYPDVAALQQDLDAFSEGLPLPHAGNSRAERAAKWFARHRGAVGVGGGAALLGALGIAVGAVRYAAAVGEARDEALLAARLARISDAESRLSIAQLRAGSDPGGARAAADAAYTTLAEVGADLRRATLVRSALEDRWPSPAVSCLAHPGAGVAAVAVDRHANRVGSVGTDGSVRLLDPAGCRTLGSWALPPGRGAIDLASGAAMTVTGDGVALLDLASGEVARAAGAADGWFQDGRPWVRLLDGAVRQLPDGPTWPARADGAESVLVADRVLAWSISGTGGLFRADGSALWVPGGVTRAAGDAAHDVALMAGGTHLAAVELASGRPRWESSLEVTVGRLSLAAEAPRALWTQLGGRALGVLDLATGRELARRDAPHGVSAAALDPTGRVIATGDGDGRVAILPLRDPVVADLGVAHALAVAPSGAVLAYASDDRDAVGLLDLPTRAPLARFAGFPDGVRAVAFDPSGVALAIADRSGAVEIVALGGGTRTRIPVAARPLSLLWEEDALWAGLRDGTLVRIDPGAGRVVAAWPVGEGAALWDLAASPAGIAVAGHGDGADAPGPRLVDRRTGAVHARAAREPENHYQLAVDGEGRVWVARESGVVRGWDPSGGPERTFRADEGPTVGIAIDRVGGLLVTAGFRQRLGVHDPAIGELLYEGPPLGEPATRVVVDGDRTAWTLAGGHLASLPLDACGPAARASAALAARPDPGALAAVGWWGRVEPALDARIREGGADDPKLRVRARLAAGLAPTAAELPLLTAGP